MSQISDFWSSETTFLWSVSKKSMVEIQIAFMVKNNNFRFFPTIISINSQ